MLSILLALAAQTSSGKLPPAQALPPPVGEEQAVLAPINQMFAAFSAGDSAGLLRVVYPNGRVTAVGTLRSGNGLRQQSWTEFAGRLTAARGGPGEHDRSGNRDRRRYRDGLGAVRRSGRRQGQQLRRRPLRPDPRKRRVEGD